MTKRTKSLSVSGALSSRRATGGFVHVLLLVLVILGIGMWGVSELLERTVKQKQATEFKSDTNLEAARRALFEYALVAPDGTEALSLPGHFNVYRDIDNNIPFRRFALPCPDVTGDDSNLDGISDSLQASCSTGVAVLPLQSGALFGRLPWREFNGANDDGEYEFVRGVGGQDFRDGFNQRLWYGLSENVSNVDTPLNPHALLRMTTGWLTINNEAGETVSDRVVAIVISPGLYGGDNTGSRIDEEFLYSGDGGTALPIDAATGDIFHQSYLQSITYAGITTGSVSVDFSTTDSYADRVEYLTIDDLTAYDGDGIALLENDGAENIYDILGGNSESHLGITELWAEHLHRFGYLPEPVMFDDNSANSRSRLSGPPAQTTVIVSYSYPTVTLTFPETETTMFVGSSPSVTTATMTVTTDITTTVTSELPFQQGAMVSSALTVSVAMRISDLPPVYMAAGAGISIGADNPAMSAPYNIPLADLRTGLNDIASLSAAVSTSLVAARFATNDDYPSSGLFGLNDGTFGVEVMDFPITVVTTGILPTAVTLDTPLDITLRDGNDFPVVLADAAYGYFQNSVLISIVSFPDSTDSDAAIAKLPPYAARVLLPAGTFLILQANDIVVHLPSDFQFIGRFNPATGQWMLTRPSTEPVIIDSVSGSRQITVVGVPDGWAVESGDVGMLPIENASVTTIISGQTLSLSANKNAISDLAVEMNLYTDNDITLVPFPPPGRPVSDGITLVPSPGMSLASPLVIPANTEFSLPVGGRIIYPAGSSFSTGDSFAFPAGAVVQYPAGATVEMRLPVNAILPSGRALGNVAATITAVVLHHGGVVALSSARPVLAGGAIVAPRQKLFDIELRGDSTHTQLSMGMTLTTMLSAGRVIQPFTGRVFEAEPAWRLPEGAVIVSDTRLRAKFLTHPRRVIVQDVDEVYDASNDNKVTLATVRVLIAPDNIAEVAADITASFSEDSEFLLPARFNISIQYSTLNAGPMMVTIMSDFVLPENTGVFDPELASELFEIKNNAGNPVMTPIGDTEITLIGGEILTTSLKSQAVLLNEALSLRLASSITVVTNGAIVTRGIAENHLVLLPDTDIYFFSGGIGSTVSLIAAGSIVDLYEGVVYPPVGVQRVRRVADDLQIRSGEAIHIYFDSPTTLRTDFDILSLDLAGDLVRTMPPATVSMRYVSYSSIGTGSVGVATVASDFKVPANSYIIVPTGSEVDFLSRQVAAPNATAETSDYAHLPEDAVLVVPPDGALEIEITVTTTVVSAVTSTMTSTMTTSIAGPAYVRVGSADFRSAIVGHESHTGGDPLVFLSDTAYLRDGLVPNVNRENIYAPIPGIARLDINGYVEKRSDSGFYGDLMPINNAEFLRDFPIIYAVAAECREAVSPGAHCAEGEGEGLLVSLQAGEEYVLQEDLIAPDSALITSNLTGVSLVIEAMQINGAPTLTLTASALLIDEQTGAVALSPSGLPYIPQANDQLIVRTEDSLNPTELRSYFDVGAFADPLSDKHYVAVDGALTVYVGGYTGEASAMAIGKAILSEGGALTVGVGGRLAGGGSEGLFGADSSATLNFGSYQAEVDLADYVLLNPVDYNLFLTLSADAVQIGLFGDTYNPFNVPAVVNAGIGVGGRLGDEALSGINYGGFAAISVAAGATIPMEPGYLWQGYVPATGVTLGFSQSDIVNSYTSTIGNTWPAPSVYLRVQPTVSALNSWGSGLELPEALDGLSQINPPVIETVSATEYVIPDVAIAVTDLGMTLSNSLIQQNYEGGFFAPLSSTSPVSSLPITIRIRSESTGATEEVEGQWRPIAVVTDATPPVTMTALRWNSKSNPIPGDVGGAFVANRVGLALTPTNVGFTDGTGGSVSVTLFTVNPNNNRDVWAGRRVTVTGDDNQAENAYIDSFMCNGVAATAVFNAPHYQMVGSNDAPVYVAWQIPAAGTHAHVTSVVVPGGSTSADLATAFSLDATQLERPIHTPMTTLPAGFTGFAVLARASHPTAVSIVAGSATLVTVNSDLVFYMDRAYNAHSGVPAQTLHFGNDFVFSGPGAIVPPFGGNTTLAVADVYAERSNLMNAVLGYPPLSPLYDDTTGSCMSTATASNCAAMYNNADWQPILNGVLSFEGVNVSIVGAAAPDGDINSEVRLILPQPQAVVENAVGDLVTIYAGSIIYPRRQLIYPSVPLPVGEYELHLDQSAETYAAVDVSPVISPRPVHLYRDSAEVMKAGDFNYAPIRVTTTNGDCIVEPLNFKQENIIDFSQLVTTAVGAVTVTSNVSLYSGDGTTLTLRYDGTHTRGFLLGEGGVDLITTYYSGERLADAETTFSLTTTMTTTVSGTTPMTTEVTLTTGYKREFSPYSWDPSLYDTDTVYAVGVEGLTVNTRLTQKPLPLHNTDIPFVNPLAYRWTKDPFGTLFAGGVYPFLQPLGSDPSADSAPEINTVQATTPDGFTVGIPNKPSAANRQRVDNNLVGVDNNLVGVFEHTSGDEFLPLRLAHRINIPPGKTLSFSGYTGELAYPSSANRMFQFPDGSMAEVLNVDGGSWVASHPYLARYAQGLEISDAGATLTIGRAAGRTTVDPKFNDGYSQIDVGNHRVLHYHRSESSPVDAAFSATPVYTNVWVRLPRGGQLVNKRTGQVVVLPDNSMLNPIMGTYIALPDNISGAGFEPEVENNYLAGAVANAELTLVRPALTIPAGARLVVGKLGGVLENVKAIAMFSLSPLESVDCPTGEVDILTGQLTGQITDTLIDINQLTEGVETDAYEQNNGQNIALGHPCLWLDDPENMDGDRFYLYRSRQRYADENLKARVESNDRTYVLGGKLTLIVT